MGSRSWVNKVSGGQSTPMTRIWKSRAFYEEAIALRLNWAPGQAPDFPPHLPASDARGMAVVINGKCVGLPFTSAQSGMARQKQTERRDQRESSSSFSWVPGWEQTTQSHSEEALGSVMGQGRGEQWVAPGLWFPCKGAGEAGWAA